jgi:hypothetical protein
LAKLTWRPFEEARTFARALGLKSQSQWVDYCQNGLPGKPPTPLDIPKAPWSVYQDSGWISIGNWLGTGRIADQLKEYRTYGEAQKFVSSLKLKNQRDWYAYCAGKLKHLAPKPRDIPSGPERTYHNNGWKNLGEWLGTGVVAPRQRVYLSFQNARNIVRRLGIKSQSEWRAYTAGRLKVFGSLPEDIPACPWATYKDEGWISLGDWLGTSTTATRYIKYLPFKKARSFIRKLKLKSDKEWKLYMAGKLPQKGMPPSNIPLNARRSYKDSGWISIGDWLGTGKIADQKRTFKPFHKARKFARSLKLKSAQEWRDYSKGGISNLPPIPDDIPCNPNNTYRETGWVSFGDWIGHDNASRHRILWSYEKCAAFVRNLKLRSQAEWFDYKRRAAAGKAHLPLGIPRNPERAFRGKGWIDLGHWLGTGSIHISKKRQ